ncbi:MAG: hypothetical protein FWF79_10315 [Defluviitaleaceae bacterium]|nr:hypothetical protein [Defluviitaleaceae bacterium]
MYKEEFLVEVETILQAYKESFSSKTYSMESNISDILMESFGISASLKRENRQYWGRELGMIWQLIVNAIFKHHGTEYAPALKFGLDEPCDLICGNDAIDTKYRIGSGDSGTLKKFKNYGHLLRSNGFRPVLLLLRDDSLTAAITACKTGGWEVFENKDSFDYIFNNTGVDIVELLHYFENKFQIMR